MMPPSQTHASSAIHSSSASSANNPTNATNTFNVKRAYNLKSLDQAMERLSNRLAQANEHAGEQDHEHSPADTTNGVNMVLPGLSDTARAIPNYIARSGLFAPVRRGWRTYHDDTTFLTGKNILLKGTGKQLTEDHADIWMHAMFLQTTVQTGQAPRVNRADFLRALGRPTGGSAYEWLHTGMQDLAQFCLRIEAKRADGSIKYSLGHHPATRVLPMIGGFDYENGEYQLFIDARWAQIFANREYTLIDWEKRLSMRYELSKSLQRLIGTSSDPEQRYSLDILKDRAAYTGPMHKFCAVLERSLLELESLNIIAGTRIETNAKGNKQAIWNRVEK